MDWLKTSRPERYELYDLSEDIDQSEDLADRMPETVKEMAAEMDRVWGDIQAEAPVWPEWTIRCPPASAPRWPGRLRQGDD